MKNEIWKDVPGYESYYQISNLGNVKSLSRNVYRQNYSFVSKEKILNCTQRIIKRSTFDWINDDGTIRESRTNIS